jgi:hypothetical protein
MPAHNRREHAGPRTLDRPRVAMADPNAVQNFWFARVVLLPSAMLTVATLPVDVSNSTLPVASKSPESGDSWRGEEIDRGERSGWSRRWLDRAGAVDAE